MPTPPKKKIVVKMKVRKTTPGTKVYQAEAENSPIPTLYIKKSAEMPDTITVTVT